jgi:hypothetical protein
VVIESFYPWFVFVHVLGAFTFAIAHGVSAAVALRLRYERKAEGVRALLELSQIATGGMYVGIFVLLTGGITAAFVGGLWGRGWIWAAIVILLLVMGYMYARASRYYGELRGSAGLVNYQAQNAPLRADAAEMARLLASPRGIELAAVGTVALVAILWLMFFKPF